MPTYSCTVSGGENAWKWKFDPTTVLNYNGSPLTLKPYEYPTGISFSGFFWNREAYDSILGTGQALIVLCDSTGGNAQTLANLHMQNPADPSDYIRVAASTANKSNQQWKALQGKSLAIGKRSNGEYRQYCVTYDGTSITVRTEYVAREIVWTDPSLSFSQNEYELTVTMGGSATDSWGGTPSYRLKMDGTDVGAFTDGIVTVTLTDEMLEVPHAFELVAVSIVDLHTAVSVGATVSHTPHSVHKTVKYWNGSAWVECVVSYYYNGEWVEVEPHYWNGSDWVPCSHT